MTNSAPVSESASAVAGSTGSTLKNRVISGSMWTILSYGAGQILRLAGNLVFARLLFPEAFGVMAMVNVFVQGLAMFSDIGIGPSLIQSRRGEDPRFINTAWSIQVTRGILLWIVSLIGARPFAIWYHEPQLALLIPVAALTAIVSGFNSTRIFTASRRIALARLTMIDFASQTLGLAAMVVWCFVSRTVWAIVFGTLIGAVVKMVLSYVALDGERNGFAFEREAFQELTRFGRWVFVSTALSFLTSQVDKLMLGKFVPMGMLGIYNISMNLASLPPMVTAALAGWVLFPLFAHHSRTDPQAFEKSIFSARRFILEGALFLFAGLALVSPAFFRILYDQRYAEAGKMTQLLTVPMWIWILMLSADRAVLAVGESRTLAVSNAASLAGKFAACFAGFRLGGVPGFIFGLSVGNLAGHVPIVLSLRRRGVHILRQDLAFTALATALIGGGIWIQRWATAQVGEDRGTAAELAVATLVVVPLGLRLLKTGRTALAKR
jgi:O-antigen/teichoic acid export membrane protein